MALTAERLRDALHYDPETGQFTWRIRSGGKSTVGSKAGCLDTHGYIKISLDCGRYYAHRLTFLYMTGEWPDGFADHINRHRADNRWANLRSVSPEGNARNSGVRARNRLGVKGVWQLPCGTYRARIYRDKKSHSLGCFPTIQEAADAYARAGGVS